MAVPSPSPLQLPDRRDAAYYMLHSDYAGEPLQVCGPLSKLLVAFYRASNVDQMEKLRQFETDTEYMAPKQATNEFLEWLDTKVRGGLEPGERPALYQTRKCEDMRVVLFFFCPFLLLTT